MPARLRLSRVRNVPLSRSTLEELRREQEPQAQPAPPARDPQSAQIARLQQSAGNAAVGRVLSRRARPSGPQLARYDSFEHAKAGDKAAGSQNVKIAGETVTSGEINALADLYGSPEELAKANPAELKTVLGLVRDQVAGKVVSEDKWDTATGGRYTKLAMANSPHFGPGNPSVIAPAAGAPAAGADNRSMFLKYFTDTVAANHAAAAASDPAAVQAARDRAVLTAGFAEHYLMDMFSAGHLFNKDDFLGRLRANLGKIAKDKLDDLFETVAKGVLADKDAKALLGKYEPAERVVLLGGWRPNFSKQFALEHLLAGLYKDAEGRSAIESGLVKAAHDHLSERDAGGGLQGVEVKNKFETWILSGDRTLATSKDTQRIIEQTLVKFRQVVADLSAGFACWAPAADMRSSAGGGTALAMRPQAPAGPPMPTAAAISASAQPVLDLTPVPTDNSVKMIEALVKRTIDTSGGMQDALIKLMIKELPGMLKVIEGRGMIKEA